VETMANLQGVELVLPTGFIVSAPNTLKSPNTTLWPSPQNTPITVCQFMLWNFKNIHYLYNFG